MQRNPLLRQVLTRNLLTLTIDDCDGNDGKTGKCRESEEEDKRLSQHNPEYQAENSPQETSVVDTVSSYSADSGYDDSYVLDGKECQKCHTHCCECNNFHLTIEPHICSEGSVQVAEQKVELNTTRTGDLSVKTTGQCDAPERHNCVDEGCRECDSINKVIVTENILTSDDANGPLCCCYTERNDEFNIQCISEEIKCKATNCRSVQNDWNNNVPRSPRIFAFPSPLVSGTKKGELTPQINFTNNKNEPNVSCTLASPLPTHLRSRQNRPTMANGSPLTQLAHLESMPLGSPSPETSKCSRIRNDKACTDLESICMTPLLSNQITTAQMVSVKQIPKQSLVQNLFNASENSPSSCHDTSASCINVESCEVKIHGPRGMCPPTEEIASREPAGMPPPNATPRTMLTNKRIRQLSSRNEREMPHHSSISQSPVRMREKFQDLSKSSSIVGIQGYRRDSSLFPVTPKVVQRTDLRFGTAIGKGAFGQVFKGIFQGRPVAIKVVQKRRGSGLHREILQAERLAFSMRLKHKHIVQILGVNVCEDVRGEALIIMELVSSRTLQCLLDDASVEFPQVDRIRYAIELTSALHYLHSHQVVHLDVKPKNVLLREDGRSKLADFGNLTRIQDGIAHEDTDFTQLLGTLPYRAPELMKGEFPTSKADIYSLGITLWQMASREIPHHNVHAHWLIYQVIKANCRPKVHYTGTDVIETSYCCLYEACWDVDVHSRPTSTAVLETLAHIEQSISNNSQSSGDPY